MNPMSLLTKGHTVRGLKERPGHYKLLGKNPVPKFCGSKAAVPTTPHADVEKAPLALTELPQPTVQSQVPRLAPLAKLAPAKVKPAKPSLWSRWVAKVTALREKPAHPRATIQTELALDKVKVIRNDLNDQDLEVVAMEKKAGKKTGKPAQVEEGEPEKLTANP
jgi:hypothetical protein